MVKHAWEYRWSSAALHTGMTKHDELAGGDAVLRQMIGNWKKYLWQAEEDAFVGDDTQRGHGEPAGRGSSIYQKAGEAVSVHAQATETGPAAEKEK